MNTKKLLLIILAGVLAVILVVAGVLLATQFKSEANYAARISQAQQYLDQNDFEHAILEYQAAITLDQTKVPAYIGLSNVYYRQGMTSLARKTLEDALPLVNDRAELVQHIAMLFPKSLISANSVSSGEGEGEEELIIDTSMDPVLNVELLQFVASANYSDYQNKFDRISAEWADGKCVVRIRELSANLFFYDTGTRVQINSSTKNPYPECIPNEIRFDTVSLLFGGVSKVTYTQLRNLTGVTDLREENGRVTFMTHGCSLSIACDAESAILANADNYLIPTGGAMAVERKLYGRVINATTGSGVTDAELIVGKDGYGNAQQSVRTDYTGAYQAILKEGGNYNVTIKKNGYIEENFRIYIPDGASDYQQDFTISPSMSVGEIRLVLTWGASPTDLDSYLTGTASDGSWVKVYYAAPSAADRNGNAIADLDVDDTSSYGPETITLHDVNGSYEYHVEDYTRSTGIGTSGATVKIYQGNSLIATVSPDADIGFGWSVCRIENGIITVTNTAMNP